MKNAQEKKEKVHKTRLKKGDKVQVIAGKSKGEVGKILVVDRKKAFFYIEGINIQKKHVKPNQKNQRGGILSQEGPVHFSNVLLFSEKEKKGKRLAVRMNKEGAKERVFAGAKD